MTDPLFINADGGAPEYSAVELRRSLAMLLTPGVADGLGARAGVRPGGSPAVTLAGTTVNILPRPVVVYPGESSTDGPYVGHLMTDSHALDPADGSNPRIDIITMRVYDDDHDASGMRELVTEYTAGTPAAGPVAPTPDPGVTVLAEVLVPAGGSPAPSLTYVTPFTVASGGVLPVRAGSEAPVAGLYQGMLRYNQASDALEAWDGSAWRVLASTRSGWETVVRTSISGATNVPIPSNTYDMVRVYLRGTLSGAGFLLMRVNNDVTGSLHREQFIVFAGDGTVSQSGSGDGTAWTLARWTNTANCVAQAVIYNTDASAALSYEGKGYRTTIATGTNRQHTIAGGALSANRLLSSLWFGSDVTLGSTEVWIEGHRA